jgi:hypothetical protein
MLPSRDSVAAELSLLPLPPLPFCPSMGLTALFPLRRARVACVSGGLLTEVVEMGETTPVDRLRG